MSADARIPLALLLNAPTAADQATLSAAERDVWKAARARAVEASIGGPFDIRHVFSLTTPCALAAWQARRRVWMVALFADDPRVVVEAINGCDDGPGDPDII